MVPLLVLPAVVLVACVSKTGRRFLGGHPMDGELRTNATFFRAPTKARHLTADRSAWHWRPGWHRSAARLGSLTVVVTLGYGLLEAHTVTLAVLALAAAALLALAVWRLYQGARSWWRAIAWDDPEQSRWLSIGAALALPVTHHVQYRRPLRAALAAELGTPPARVRVPLDRAGARIVLAGHFTGDSKAQEGVARVVSAKLALEAAEPAWRLYGARPHVTFRTIAPPPGRLTWDDMAAEIASAKPAELISGGGHKDSTVRASLELDSPHFGLAAGTGGGKSSLAAFWLVQALMRGDIVLILDAKRFSHPWAFKDMDAEYSQLPNVAYCRTVPDLHDAMCWLSGELDRRNGVAERGINARGEVRGDVGPRLWVLGEEMNLAHGPLKQHWAAIRDKDDPKKSPAFTGLGAVSFAGRAVKMHLVVIGQMLKADVLGGGDVRENIGVRMLARYTANSWKMQAGDLTMPPPSRIKGRWQQIASGEVTEVQVPYLDPAQARELAVAGAVTPCPAGMPGAAPIVRPAPPGTLIPLSGQGFVRGTVEEITVGFTIKEAIADGIFGPLSIESASRRVRRAGIEPTGKRGDGSFTYARADLFRAAKDRRRKDTAA